MPDMVLRADLKWDTIGTLAGTSVGAKVIGKLVLIPGRRLGVSRKRKRTTSFDMRLFDWRHFAGYSKLPQFTKKLRV